MVLLVFLLTRHSPSMRRNMMIWLPIIVALTVCSAITAQNACNASECLLSACDANYPFLCVSGPAVRGCSPTPWQQASCSEECNYMSCFLSCSAECSSAQCTACSSQATMCTSGAAAGQCGSTETWSIADGCDACCNVTACGSQPTTPQPTTGPSPSPQLQCGTCPSNVCNLYWCGSDTPFVCIEGLDVGACANSASIWGSACSACCDTTTCGESPTAAPSTSTPVTPGPSTEAPSTEAPSTEAPSTEAPSTEAPSTEAPSTEAPSTEAPSTDAPSTEAPSTDAPSTGLCSPCSPCSIVKCPSTFPIQCISGPASGGCSNVTWSPPACEACCDASQCLDTTEAPVVPTTTAAPATGSPDTPSPGPSGPVTNPPILTPVPGWTMSPTDFPLPTPLPPSAPQTPAPSGNCPLCSQAQCDIPGFICGQAAPFLCLTGPGAKGCQEEPWHEAGCTSCCDFSTCLPPPPTPFPASPWANVPPSQNCTLNSTAAYAPSPKATPYGGIDVSAFGCLSSVSQDCCGLTPRFNWVLSTCNDDPSKRISMACNHTYGNTSRAEIYYINAYQWNRETQTWNLDPTSSVSAGSAGELVDFNSFNMTLTDNGYKQDWDLKYGPTTASQGTDGLGPPGMLFVVSAKRFVWSSFYLLNQITLNRGPGAEHYKDNCWSSSSGELDLIEPPFWAGIDLPHDRLYLTITANAGRCFPVQKKVSSRFQRECSDMNCCQMCACPPGFTCFGDPSYVGYLPMGCMPEGDPIPEGQIAFTVDGSATACGAYFGGISGGADSTAYFSHDPDADGGEVIYAAVVDADGVTVMRWASSDEGAASAVWEGIGKYNASAVLAAKNPRVPVRPRPPCTDFQTPCAVFEPSCDDSCVILSASGVFGLDQMSGPFAAEAARDGLNWWKLFDSTNQTPDLVSNQLPMFVDVPVHPVPLPFSCNVSCGPVMCHEVTRCPVTSPFMCTKGDGLNGCSNISTFWPLSPHCNSCCDVTDCVVPCLSQCTPAQCDLMNCNRQLTPYFCFAGASVGGCSGLPNYFPEQPTCDGCCDVRSCPAS